MATFNTVRNRNPLKGLLVKVIFLIISVFVVVLMRNMSIKMLSCLSQLFLETEQGLLYILCLLFSFAFNTHLKTLTYARTDETDDFIIIGPATSFCSYSKNVSANGSQRCPGRSAAHATGRGPSTGPTHLISRLRWWDWHSRVTK